MRGPLRRLTPFALAAIALACPPGWADGIPALTLGSYPPSFPLASVHGGSVTAPDGGGGAFVTWAEPGARVRVQHVSRDLAVAPGWPADGRLVGAGIVAGHERSAVLAADGAGGVYVAWAEDGSESSVYLTRLLANGSAAAGWPATGVSISPPAPLILYPAIASLGEEGVAVAWMHCLPGTKQVRVQKIDPWGNPARRWPAAGLIVGGGNGFNDVVDLAPDGRGGVFAVWTEARDRLSDVKYAQVTAAAEIREPGGRRLADEAVPPHAAMEQSHPEIAADGLGGAVVVWTDERAQQRRAINLTDVEGGWIRGGRSPQPSATRSIASGPWYQTDPRVTPDGAGGCFVGWSEMGPGPEYSGRFVHLERSGEVSLGWPAKGLAVGKVAPHLSMVGSEGLLAVSSDGASVIAQRFRLDGRVAPGWPAEGLALMSAGAKGDLHLAGDGAGGAFMVWEERRSGRVDVVIGHLSDAARTAPEPAAIAPAPLAFAVHSAYPNPARDHCRIGFDLPAAARVDVEVFDVAGRLVARPAERQAFEAGPRTVEWGLANRAGQRVAAGLYFIRVVAPGMGRGVARVFVAE